MGGGSVNDDDTVEEGKCRKCRFRVLSIGNIHSFQCHRHLPGVLQENTPLHLFHIPLHSSPQIQRWEGNML